MKKKERKKGKEEEEEDDDDVSSIGGDSLGSDGREDSLGLGDDQQINDKKKTDVVDMDDDNFNEQERREYLDAHAIIVDGFRCPDEFVDTLTPMEFEEMVVMFKTYDVNGNGNIDKHEARKILHSLGLESSLQKAEELLALIDVDGSGEIDFDEYCRFIFLIKTGDERMGAFSNLLVSIQLFPSFSLTIILRPLIYLYI